MIEKINNRYLYLFIKYAFAVLFIFAGAEKIGNPENFAAAISNYHTLPIQFVNIFAVIIPWIELLSGILLLWSKLEFENLVILNSLLAIFTILIIIAVLRGLNIDCGCFGASGAVKVGLTKIIENLFTLAAGAYLLYYLRIGNYSS